jgi:hypothetical protein
VILLAASFTWRGLAVDVAVPVGGGPKPEALQWLTDFATAKGRPLLYRAGEEWYAFGPPDVQTEMRERIGRGERPSHCEAPEGRRSNPGDAGTGRIAPGLLRSARNEAGLNNFRSGILYNRGDFR